MIIDAGSSGSRVYVYWWDDVVGGPRVKKVTELVSKTGEKLEGNSVPELAANKADYDAAFPCVYGVCPAAGGGGGECLMKTGASRPEPYASILCLHAYTYALIRPLG